MSVKVFNMVVFFFAVLFIGTRWTVEGTFNFTKVPARTVYFMEGSDATFEWYYKVDERAKEFDFVIWRVIIGAEIKPLLFENEAGVVKVSSGIPSAYVGRVEKTGQATLIVRNVTFNDSFLFRCVLSQKSGDEIDDTVRLIVTGQASVSPKPQCALIGSSIIFTCNAIDVPSGKFTWWSDDGEPRQLFDDGQRIHITHTSGSSTLALNDIAVNDTRYFKCNATANPSQPNIAQGYLEVKQTEPPTKDDEANPERSFQIAVGDEKTLCCPIKGYPPPIVMWEKNGVPLQTKVDKCYLITSAKNDQFGNYSCSATDGVKSVGPYSFSLTKKLSITVQASNSGKLAWEDVPGAQYYVVKITGNDTLDDVTCRVGKQSSMDLHFNALVLKEPEKNLEETKVCVKVVALSADDDVLAKTPTCQSMTIKSGQLTLKPNIMFFLVLLYAGWKML